MWNSLVPTEALLSSVRDTGPHVIGSFRMVDHKWANVIHIPVEDDYAQLPCASHHWMIEDVDGVQAQGHVRGEEEGCPGRTGIALYLYCVSGDRKSPALLQSRESTEQQTPKDSPGVDSASRALELLLLQMLKALCGPSEGENPSEETSA